MSRCMAVRRQCRNPWRKLFVFGKALKPTCRFVGRDGPAGHIKKTSHGFGRFCLHLGVQPILRIFSGEPNRRVGIGHASFPVKKPAQVVWMGVREQHGVDIFRPLTGATQIIQYLTQFGPKTIGGARVHKGPMFPPVY